MEEEWKLYKIAYPERKNPTIYEVSSFGRVKKNGVIITPHKYSTGYYGLCHNLLHRIVATLFIPNPENKPEVDHIDTNILNNRVDNLRWVTSSENKRNPLTLKHISKAQKGRTPWNKGKHWTEEVKDKMRGPRKKYKQKVERSEEWKKWNRERFKDKTWVVVNGKRKWIDKEGT